MKSILVLLISLTFIATANQLAGTQLSFQSTDDSFSTRVSASGTWKFGVWQGVFWNSLEVAAGNNTIEGDYIWGSISTGTLQFPSTWLAYYSANASVNRSVPNPGGQDWASFSVSEASGFLASAFLGITELNATGYPVKSLMFNDPLTLWDYNQTASTALTNKDAGITAAVFDAVSIAYPYVKIQLTYIMTQQAGTLNTAGKPFIVPKAVESFVYISGWSYANANPDNQLQLTIATASAESSWDASGSVNSGTGASGAFFRVAGDATVDGSTSSVGISANVSGNGLAVFKNPLLQAQLTGRYGASASAYVINVLFPPGAVTITYDPTTGVGENPYPNNSEGSGSQTGISQLLHVPFFNSLGLIIGLVIGLTAFVVILVAVAYYVLKSKRASYEAVTA